MSASSHRSEHTLQTLDGLRGLAILLVVLSHIWVIYPFDDLHQIAPFDGWFKAGSVAVSIFLVLSGFLVTRSMLDGFDRSGSTGPAASLVRRLLRISAQVGLLLVAVTVVAGIDDTDTASDATTKKSVFAVATYTWNWYVRDNAFEARSDLGHLWYLSVELHVFIVLALAIALWGRRRTALTVAVVVLIVGVTWWRWHVYETEGWYSASLRTSTRADAALWGVLAGLLWDRASQWRREAPAAVGAATLLLLAIIFSGTQLGIDAYFKAQGIAVAAAATLFVLAASLDHQSTSPASRLFAARPLRSLGAVSLTLYVWHLPVFHAVTRHTAGWSNISRLILTVVGLGLLVTALHRWVDEPVSRWTRGIGRPRHAKDERGGLEDRDAAHA
ncbi:acyltransferase family protein [Knoellia sp. LjRoot47]|uniref:acyltransferase family protein n=1 Tax=Knoellia sp. LjRoot47 TaxID=3342330 RepID=UPI003ECFBDE0